MKIQASRRRFMAKIVGAAAAAKLMPLMPREAFGAAETPRRLLCVFHPMGYLENSFWPTGQGSSFKLGETQSALEPYKDKLLYINGLLHSAYNFGDRRANNVDNTNGTGIAGMFTGSNKDRDGGYALSESIDQTVANHLHERRATPHKSIALGYMTGPPGPHNSAFFSGPGRPITAIDTPRAAFEKYFSKLPPSSPGAFDRRVAAKKSVIDALRADYDAVCSRLGTQERKLCDGHLEGLRELENRLQALALEGRPECVKPEPGVPIDDPEQHIRAQMGIIRAAFACDLTNVATLQLGGADGGVDIEGYPNHHVVTDAVGDGPPSLQIINDNKLWDRFYAKQWLYLLQQLSSIPEGTGTMLDNTLVLFGTASTTGQTLVVGAHQGYRLPTWIAGGNKFAFPTGRQVTVPLMQPNTPATAANSWGYNHSNGKFLYHNALLVSVAQAFGLPVNAYGTLDQGVGGVPGLR